MLEIGKHTNINTTNLKKPTKKIISSVMGVVIAISTYSGAMTIKASATNSYNENYETIVSSIEDEVEIPAVYRSDVAFCCGKEENVPITKSDLAKMNYLNFWLEQEPPTFLEYCTSLETVIVKTQNNNLNNIEWFNKVPSLTSFSLISKSLPVEINRTNAAFLMNKKVTEVRLKGHITVEPELLQSIPNLKYLTVVYNDHTKVDYNGLKSLKNLNIEGEPYDISITTSTDDLKDLRNQGVKVSIDSWTENKMEYIENKLNDIIESLNIKAEDNDQTKLNKIVLYILEQLKYDEEMNRKMYVNDSDVDEYSDTFYENGALYGALEMDTQICGNYAALTSALCKRLNIDSYLLISTEHSWNLVNVGGDYYYVDTTWIDNNLHLTLLEEDGKTLYENKTAEDLLKSGNIGFIKNYMDEPLSYKDTSHDVLNYPSTLVDDIEVSKEKGVYNKDKNPISNFTIPVEEAPVVTTIEEAIPVTTKETTKVTTAVEPEISIEYKPVINEETTMPIMTEKIENSIPDIKEEEYKLEIGGREIILTGGALMSLLVALGVGKGIKKKKEKKKEEKKIENKFRI